MKKSLVALAVLAASGAVMAQSSVTLYGKADVGLRKVTGAATQMQENHASRWGLMGTEDLGGGLKATFRFENRFNLDTGANNNGLPGTAKLAPRTLMFRAQSNVGLAGSFGSVKFGRIYNPVEEINGGLDPWTNDGVAASQLNGLFYTRQDNSIRYDSPSMSGFAAHAIWSAGEGGADLAAPALPGEVNDGVGISVTYKAGPLYVGVGYDKKANRFDSDFAAIGASYAFGDAKVGVYYDEANIVTVQNGPEASDNVTGLFATYKLGSGLIKAGYTSRERDTGPGTASTKNKRYGIGYQYNMSKRTSIYADYARNDFGNPVTRDTNGTQIGITHNF